MQGKGGCDIICRIMSELKNICVYLGSSGRADEIYKQATVELGVAMAKAGIGLVYGGGKVGLMGLLADTVLENGGHVIGIIPEHLAQKEVAHKGVSELLVVPDMHTRKRLMVEKSDAFVIMPGGIGTLDETCEVLTWKQIGMHGKPIVFADIDGYWQPFYALIDHLIETKFMREGDKGLYRSVESVDAIIPCIRDMPTQAFDPASKWI